MRAAVFQHQRYQLTNPKLKHDKLNSANNQNGSLVKAPNQGQMTLMPPTKTCGIRGDDGPRRMASDKLNKTN